MAALQRRFFARDTLEVARALLGKKLVRRHRGKLLSGMITETEAYIGMEDTACHASRGRTQRNAVMFGAPGVSYVYFVYGMHYMLNVVTEAEGAPCAVLVRGLLPLSGIEEMENRRKLRGKALANGPAKLCQALAIDTALNAHDLTRGEELWIEPYRRISPDCIHAGPRVGIAYAAKRDREAPWRLWIDADE